MNLGLPIHLFGSGKPKLASLLTFAQVSGKRSFVDGLRCSRNCRFAGAKRFRRPDCGYTESAATSENGLSTTAWWPARSLDRRTPNLDRCRPLAAEHKQAT